MSGIWLYLQTTILISCVNVENNRRSDKYHKSNDECGGAIFTQLCAVSNKSNKESKNSVQLDHHIHDQLYNTWRRQPSKPQPSIELTVKVITEDYNQLGSKSIANLHLQQITISAMAGTGCQSCLIGLKCLQKLGIHKKELIPVTMKIRTANSSKQEQN